MARKSRGKAVKRSSSAKKKRSSSRHSERSAVNVRIAVPGKSEKRASSLKRTSGRLSLAPTRDDVKRHMSEVTSRLSKHAMNPVAASIALPHEYPVVRVSEGYSLKPTSVCSPFSILTKNETVSQQMGFILTRDVTRAFATTTYLPSTSGYVYQLYFSSSEINGGNWINPTYFHVNGLANFIGTFNLPIQYGQSITPPSPTVNVPVHGAVLYGTQMFNKQCIFMNKFDCLIVNAVGASFPTSSSITIYEVVGRDLVFADRVSTPAAATVTLRVPNTGYYSFDMNVASALTGVTGLQAYITCNDPNTASIDPPSNRINWGWSPVNDLQIKAATLNSVRVNGAAILVTNIAQVLQNNGIISMNQIGKGVSMPQVMYDMITDTDYIGKTQGSYSGKWVDGGYGFLKPDGPSEITMQSPFTFDQEGRLMSVTTPAVSDAGYLAIQVSSAVTEGTSHGANIARVTVTHGLEFVSTDTWFDMAQTALSVEEYGHLARDLVMIPQFHENPFHLSDIINGLAKAGKFMLGIAPHVMDALGTVVPQARPFVGPVKGIVSAINSL